MRRRISCLTLANASGHDKKCYGRLWPARNGACDVYSSFPRAKRRHVLSYVTELLKMKDTFIEPLLHPYIVSPVSSPTPLDFFEDLSRAETPRESLDHLPIAARFLSSPTGDRSDSPAPAGPSPRKEDNHPNIDGESMDSAEEEEAEDRMGATLHSSKKKTVTMSLAAKHNHPRSPYGSTAVRSGASKYGTTVPFPSRSHQSLPPPPRANQMASSTQSLGRQSFMDDHAPSMKTTTTGTTRVLRKFKKSSTGPEGLIQGAVPPAQLPEDLRKCLEVIESSILDGHIRLSEGLRKRYEDQYPLVRSLADVFVTNVRNQFEMSVRRSVLMACSHTFCTDTLRMSCISSGLWSR